MLRPGKLYRDARAYMVIGLRPCMIPSAPRSPVFIPSIPLPPPPSCSPPCSLHHATHRTPNGVSRLVQPMPTCPVKRGRCPSRHCRDVTVYSHMTTTTHHMEYPPPPPPASLPPLPPAPTPALTPTDAVPTLSNHLTRRCHLYARTSRVTSGSFAGRS